MASRKEGGATVSSNGDGLTAGIQLWGPSPHGFGGEEVGSGGEKAGSGLWHRVRGRQRRSFLHLRQRMRELTLERGGPAPFPYPNTECGGLFATDLVLQRPNPTLGAQLRLKSVSTTVDPPWIGLVSVDPAPRVRRRRRPCPGGSAGSGGRARL